MSAGRDAATLLGERLRAAGWTLAVAESCTGGLIGHRVTAVAGSSTYFSGGVIAYSNAVKAALLGVDPEALRVNGAVSEAVARQMARGVRRCVGSDVGLSVTGIAGPGGGTPGKPVGLVYIGVAGAAADRVEKFVLKGDRAAVREAAAETALRMAEEFVQREGKGHGQEGS